MTSQDRKEAGSAAADLLPKGVKRTAPRKKERTRTQAKGEHQKYGTPTCFRWSDEFREALKIAEIKYDVAKKDLVRYATTRLLIALENGETTLPISGHKRKVLDIPDPPHIQS